MHFSAGEPGEDGVISGMRKSAGLNSQSMSCQSNGNIHRTNQNDRLSLDWQLNEGWGENIMLNIFDIPLKNMLPFLYPDAKPQLMTAS